MSSAVGGAPRSPISLSPQQQGKPLAMTQVWSIPTLSAVMNLPDNTPLVLTGTATVGAEATTPSDPGPPLPLSRPRQYAFPKATAQPESKPPPMAVIVFPCRAPLDINGVGTSVGPG